MSDGEGFIFNDFEFDQFQFEQNNIQENVIFTQNEEYNFSELQPQEIDFEQNISSFSNAQQKDKISSTFQLNEEKSENFQQENRFLLQKSPFDEKINISRSRSRENEKELNSKQKRWTQQEEDLLSFLHDRYNGDWNQIILNMQGRTISQCKQYWQRKHKVEKKKSQWTAEEDQIIKDNINRAENNWAAIAKILKNKTGKQIRERYINQLRDDALEGKKQPWTQEEDNKITDLFQQYGAKWSQISKYFPIRSELQIKNRANKILKITPKNQDFQDQHNCDPIIIDEEIKTCHKQTKKNTIIFEFPSHSQTINSCQQQQS